jgi:hypothetical protein
VRAMSQDVFKAPKAKKKHSTSMRSPGEPWSKKRKRTKEDFYTFCNIVLEYTNYESIKQEELRCKNNTSPLDSGGSTAESFTSESTSSSTFSEAEPEDKDHRPDGLKSPDSTSSFSSDNDSSFISPENYDGESFELVTCYCMKPFAGRPMIECSECFTWVHLSCAKIRKSNIPEEFICQRCRESKFTTRKSQRMRLEKRLMNA